MSQKLVDITPQHISSGIWPSGEEEAIPLWSDGSNVLFNDRGVQKMLGWSAALTAPGTDPIRGMFQYRTLALENILYFGDKAKIYKLTDTVVTTEGTGYTGNETAGETFWDSGSTTWDSGSTTWDGASGLVRVSTWSFANFGDWVIATNGKDVPQIDKGTGFSSLPTGGIFSTSHIVRRFGPHMIMYGTDVDGKELVWSTEDDPEQYIPTSANQAGSLKIREALSDIVAVEHLNNQHVVFDRDSMYLVRYIGSPLYFGYQQIIPSGAGAVSKNSVIAVDRMLYVMSESGFYRTDGVQIEPIDTDEIKAYVFDNINISQIEKSAGFHDQKNDSVRWYYLSSGTSEPDRAVVYNYRTQKWSILDHGRTAALPKHIFENPVTGDESGSVFFENFGNDADGSALSTSLISKPMDLDQESLIKTFDRLRVGWEGAGLQYRLGTADNPNDSFSYTNWASVSTDRKQMDIRKTGRFMRIEFRSTSLGDNWDLKKITVEGTIRGSR